MDCCFASQSNSSQIIEACSNVSSPEMFDSDTESEVDNKHVDTVTNNGALITISPQKPSQAELIAKSDSYLLARINKHLSGVPPPPRHTICQKDCSDILQCIHENRQFFWINCPLSNGSSESEETAKSTKDMPMGVTNKNILYQCTKGPLRNLTNAFDACDLSVNADSAQLGINSNNGSRDKLNIKSPSNVIEQTMRVPLIMDNSSISEEQSPLLYHTVDEIEVTTLTWPQAYTHKFHGIHYNRSKIIEEFESLTVKLCERYIGAETQSTCNIWFSKQLPGSAKKRSLLVKRENSQSPGKRLIHLARRRKTFSSANLQGLGLTDKRQLILQVKKSVYKKGKSPRGKSPRGKSPRGKSPRGKSPRGKSPRNSAIKKVVRRLMLDGPNSHKCKLETSKRALFQSPPMDAGPSKLLNTTNVDTQKIKRVLFPTSPKENESEDLKQTLLEESRKRKCEEELQGPRIKWAKSLSFACTHELQNSSKISWDRHSSGSILSKNDTSFTQGKNELSNTNRKKLLWAVAEALRSKGIGMTHPKFKQYAANLACTIKKFMPDLENKNIPRKSGSTSDRMLKLAKHHVLFLDTRPTD